MRPLRLEMQAFGPYAGRQVIDFTELGGHSVFLIHGPTGSGKTTILDAMCFALFGDTSSGTERDARAMRSQHARPGDTTEVRFEFELHGTRYRVERAPEQEKWAERGQKRLVKMPARGTLWKLAGGEQVIAGKYTDVRETVERLLGFTSAQFRQVILIPQGKFREMLCAKQADREEVLRYLFGTMRYDHLEQFLKDREKGLRQEFQNTQAVREGVLRQVPDAQKPEDVQAMITGLGAQQVEASGQLNEAVAAKSLADAALQKALEQNRRLQELSLAQGAWQKIQAEFPGMQVQRGKLQLASRANALAGPYNLLQTRRRDLELAGREQQASTERVAQAQQTLVQAQKELEQGKVLKPQLEALDREIASLEASRQIASELDRCSVGLAMAQKSLKAEEAATGAAQAELKRGQAARETLQGQLQRAQDLAGQVAARQKLLELAEKTRKDALALRDWEPRLGTQQKLLQEKDAKLKQQRELYCKVETELRRLDCLWREGVAVRLAQKLSEGAACPVCGSTEHPRPAAGAGEIVTDKQLADMQAQRSATVVAGEKLNNEVSKLQVEAKETQARVELLRANLGERAGAGLDVFEAEYVAAQRAVMEAGSAADSLPRLQANLTAQDQALLAAQGALTQRQKKLVGLQKEVAGLGAECETLRKQIPAHAATVAALNAVVADLREKKGEIAASLEKAELAESEAGRKLAAAAEAAKGAAEAIAARQKELQAASEEFALGLREQTFASEQGYLAARLAEVQMRGLEEQLEQFAQRESAARARLESAQAEAAGVIAPDVAALQTVCQKAEEAVAGLNRRLGEVANQVTQYTKVLAELGKLSSDLGDLERRHGVLARLAEVAGGRNNLGVSLERFVLGFMLDDVTAAASLRLKNMSRGRYFLQRQCDAETRQPTGLNLDVFDSYTGMSRDVSTLSGGESFLASLSMALGLADVVQARAGGVAMETIFIDEGFGSLDSETLDSAIDAIRQIIETGRLVGIISHVSELREAIPAQLVVTATREGSSAAFCIR